MKLCFDSPKPNFESNLDIINKKTHITNLYLIRLLFVENL